MIKNAIKRGAIRIASLPPLFRLMNKALNTRPIIFALHRRANPEHGIGGHDPATVRQQLEFLLKHGYRMVTMDMIDAWVNGEDMDMTNTVAFTFDDGYRDQGELIQETFLPLGIPASMFLITNFIDGQNWPWDTKIKWLVHNAPARPIRLKVEAANLDIRLEANAAQRHRVAQRFIQNVQHSTPQMLAASIEALAAALDMNIPESPPACHKPITWNQARQLEVDGVRFGSHSLDHYIFSALSNEQADHQICASYQRVRAELNAPLSVFCYPIGGRHDFTGRELTMLPTAGYTSAVTMGPGCARRPSNTAAYGAFAIGRYGLPDDMEDFVQYASWIERVKDRARGITPANLVSSRYGSTRGLVRLANANFAHRVVRLRVSAEIDWSRVRRLVFVCDGNVCRSPFAAAVARKRGLAAVSSGLMMTQGARANPIVSRIALELGIDMTSHESRSFDPGEIQDGDLILGMESRHCRDERYSEVPADVQFGLLGLLNSGCKRAHIHDPYGLSEAYYRRCLNFIWDAVHSLPLQTSFVTAEAPSHQRIHEAPRRRQ